MMPYWKRVPLNAPKQLMELDPTHVNKHDDGFISYPWYTNLGVRMGHYRDSSDPFDFYEDALGG